MSKFGDWLKNLFGFSVGGSSDNNNNNRDTLTLPGSDKPFGWDVPVIDDGSESQPQSGFGVNFGFNTDSGDSSGLGSFLNSLTQLVPAFLNRLTAEHLTGAEREANEFSAEQAQINRDFEERMANTQYQRGVADMQAAGVNPALAYQQGGAAAPSGTPASSVNPQGSAFSMSDLMQMMLIKPQMQIMKAQAENIQADTGKKISETDLVGKHISAFDALTDAQIRDIDSRIQSREVQNRLNEQGIKESEARECLQIMQAVNTRLDNHMREALNNAQIAYQESLTKYNNALTGKVAQDIEESKQRVAESAARIDGIYQQAILQASMAGYYSQAETNLLEQYGILQYEKAEHKFTVDHQRSDRAWRLASTTVGMVTGVGQTAAGLAVGGAALGRAGVFGSTVTSASPWSFHNTGGYNWIGYN